MDETVIRIVQTSDRVSAPRSCREIGRLVSAERGKLVAVALAFSTTGNSADGFHFRQGNCRVDIWNGATAGSSSDWSDEGGTLFEVAETFCFPCETFKWGTSIISSFGRSQFAFMNRCSRLLKEDDLTVLSFAPHCSHKLQPLDRTVCGPLITYVNRACDTWIANHPGETVAIHSVPMITNKCLNFWTSQLLLQTRLDFWSL